ncbi:MAG: glucose-1-phosphate thymidylyltransferase [Marinilabiliales bacterium]|nr:MAG: glucose-1-phosphate thymidylyltransferase [Marinilabiliales bacterium]
MNYILFDGSQRENLLPLTFTRPVAEIRIGITTIREKWENLLNETTSVLTEDYLSKKYPLKKGNENILINAAVLPDDNLINDIKKLVSGESLTKDNILIASRVDGNFDKNNLPEGKIKQYDSEIDILESSWDIFSKNEKYLNSDFKIITKGRKSSHISETNNIIGDSNLVFIEEGAKVEYAYLNTSTGPIYIDKDAEVMEGSKIRGPFALCEHSTLKMDAKVYGATTIGPHCKVGGELNNVVFFGYANKAHDGFLGNAVIGEWCNLGADTNNSNLKNTYEEVKMWSYPKGGFIKSGLQFCGLIMGDHSKSGINTMFNTGTVVGVSCNIYGSGFQRNFIPSFSWGSPVGMKPYNLNKAFQVAEAVFQRRSKSFHDVEKDIFRHINDLEMDQRR